MLADAEVDVRIAQPTDRAPVDALLAVSYSVLLAPGYAASLLTRALPHMTRVNTRLLASGTYYVAEERQRPGSLVGCGGWTRERPGAHDEPVDPAYGHLRLFATHPAWTRKGVGRALFERCLADACAAGVRTLECYATTVAEGFYHALGFKTVESMGVRMGDDIIFPGVRMLYAQTR